MSTLEFTPEQRAAVETVGGSLLVTAAAGSGKTAVLAERCAYLVSDLAPAQRCDVDELLVLTFTEAAAAEMRARIIEALTQRAAANTNDLRLREQVALVDSGAISTIHAFCLGLIRRHFHEAGVDPAATVMDADETDLLRRETMDTLCDELYAAARAEGGLLGTNPAGRDDEAPEGESHRSVPETLAQRFAGLVETYGLGDDRNIVAQVLRLHDFLGSLPDPGAWLKEAIHATEDGASATVLKLYQRMRQEIEWQIEHGERLAGLWETGVPETGFFAGEMRNYVKQLRSWIAALPSLNSESLLRADESLLSACEEVRRHIAEYEPSRATGPRLARDAPDESREARQQAAAVWSGIKKVLFRQRLQGRFSAFSAAEWHDGLARVAPFVRTLADLVQRFDESYTARKRKLHVLDFADLERLAFALLAENGDPARPSSIARDLHARFAYVLVDEFQDTSPLQEAIVRLASHEAAANRPGNLFAVGDVKQSIYRFRLAEPRVFVNRLRRILNEGGAFGKAISLQRNFRSRPAVLEAVNLVFASLLRPGVSDVIYDDEATLRTGRKCAPGTQSHPVEVHLLERLSRGHGPPVAGFGSDSDGNVEPQDDHQSEAESSESIPSFGNDDPRLWSSMEREGFLIALRIRELMSGKANDLLHRPLAFRDIVVLLRAARVNAERVAAMLQRMGIPAYAEVGGTLFGAVEVREAVAALKVLDNGRQDIPLAAVLRAGSFGESFTEDELVEIRLFDQEIPFHAGVYRYAEAGPRVPLRRRLSDVLARVDRYRHSVRTRPLAAVLWALFAEEGWLARAGAMMHGAQRRANLLKLHQLARTFGSFRRQGLHRFLRFVERLKSQDRDLAAAPVLAESEDVVRVMSIHQSKGLEFPVVFVAGLGTAFHLGDRDGRIIFEREAKIGLRVVEQSRLIEYPSALHRLAADEIERNAREEELRILYVAMTRARDKLILLGTVPSLDILRNAPDGAAPAALTRLSIASATHALEWLVPALVAAPRDQVRIDGANHSGTPFIEVFTHGADEMAAWHLPQTASHNGGLLRAVARASPLPPEEPIASVDKEVDEVFARIDFLYPHSAAGTVRAAVGASEFKREWDLFRDPDERPVSAECQSSSSDFALLAAPAREMAMHRGIVMHRVLQHVDCTMPPSSTSIVHELERLVSKGILAAEELALVDDSALKWFLESPLAAAIRAAGPAYRREFPYISAEHPQAVDPTIGPSTGDFVLVRGMVDGLIVHPDSLQIIDFKTDNINASEVTAATDRYRPQVRLYTSAMQRLFRRPVTNAWLVFLTPRVIERVLF